MQDRGEIIRKGRVHDYPEFQVGFPERNDVQNPDAEPVGARPDGKTRVVPDRDDTEKTRNSRRRRVSS